MQILKVNNLIIFFGIRLYCIHAVFSDSQCNKVCTTFLQVKRDGSNLKNKKQISDYKWQYILFK